MAWNDTPPTKEEIAATESWDANPPTEEELNGHSVGGFASNLVKNAVKIPKDMANFGKNVGLATMKTLLPGTESFLPQSPSMTDIGKSLPASLINEGKRIGIGKTFTEGPVEGAKQFGQAFYDEPITTALDVLPAVGAVGKALGFGEKAAAVAPMAENVAKTAATSADDIARMAEIAGTPADEFMRSVPSAPNPVNLGSEAADILKTGASKAEGVPGTSVPLGSTFQETVQNLKNAVPEAAQKPLDKVNQLLSQKFGHAAARPGLVQNLGKTLVQKSRGMRMQEHGWTPGMVRQVRDRFGEDFVNKLADWEASKGLGKGFFDWQGRENVKKLIAESGQKIGGIREIATKRGAVHNIDDLVNQIRAELDPIYLKGSGSAQKGAYMNALDDIRMSKGDVKSLADTLTAKNKLVKKNRALQPTGAPTDVYNAASRINNELVNRFLNPKEAELYRELLRDFSAAKLFDKAQGFTFGRELAGRSTGGPWEPWNYIKDVGGRKLMEKVFSTIGKKMQRTPEAYRNPMTLTDDVLDSVNDALDEIIDQMGKGVAEP